VGVVYEAENVWTHRRVALKVLSPSSGLTEDMVERFVREARSTARLLHPNVVNILDLGADPEGQPYVVQELLDGEDLRRHLEHKGRLPLAQALDVLAPVMDALAVAHDLGIVHRDVKPANVVLARRVDEIVPTLIDFGAAKLVGLDGERGITATGELVGTPHYMAPEQLQGTRSIDARVDVWGVGATLWEAITGAPPFPGETLIQVATQILNRDAPLLSSVVPGVPAQADAVLRRALTRNREHRYQDMREMLSDVLVLRAFLAEHPEASYSDESPTEKLVPPAMARLFRTTGSHAGPRWRVGLVVTTSRLEGHPIADAFSFALGVRCDVQRFLSYAELVAAMSDGELEVAWLPPVAYLRARRARACRLLVMMERELGGGYASALLGRAAAVRSVSDAVGRRAAWVDAWSAAGYLVPRSLLRAKGVDPDAVFSSQGFLGSYPAVLGALRAGTADVGGCFCAIDRSGKIARRPWKKEDGLRVLAVSEPIPGDTLCVARTLPAEDVERLRDRLSDEEIARPLLRLLAAKRLLRAEPQRYSALERALLRR
jgi:eukaryotic-like serine/threonine-protein kinase